MPGLAASTGFFVYSRAVLTPHTDPVILEYASRNELFPNDPTTDQWFDVEQFRSRQRVLDRGRHAVGGRRRMVVRESGTLIVSARGVMRGPTGTDLSSSL